MIAPIETYYAGYRFRSRLEARWAVFFRKAGIPFEYETQGYDLGPEIGLYLPDFYLPQFRAFVEIKPMYISSEEEEIAKNKLEKLFHGYGYQDKEPGIICMFCKGDPFECTPEIYCNDANDSGGGTAWWSSKFYEDASYNDLCYGMTGYLKGVSIAVGDVVHPDFNGWSDRVFLDCRWDPVHNLENHYNISDWRSELSDAKLAARQARFEHGERGITKVS